MSKEWAPKAVAAGAVVIDNSSAFRLDPEVPLVVPEVNRDAIRPPGDHRQSQLLHDHHGDRVGADPPGGPIRRMVVSTYQSVSGAGAKAMAELEAAGEGVRPGRAGDGPGPARGLRRQALPIAFNLIPQIDVVRELGYTKEEWKMVHETRKILGEPDLAVSPTTVRVPVCRSHSESINIETEKPLSVEEARRILSEAEGVDVIDDPQAMAYPMPIEPPAKIRSTSDGSARIRRSKTGSTFGWSATRSAKAPPSMRCRSPRSLCANGWL